MVEVDTTYPRERARLARKAREDLAPLVDRIAADVESRSRAGLSPLMDSGRWSGPLAAALADVGEQVVADIGERVTIALGGIVEERAARPWSPAGAVAYIIAVANAMGSGKIDEAHLYLERAVQQGAPRVELLDHVRSYLTAAGTDMTDVAANFAVLDASERADAQWKVWQVNSGNPRSSHAAVNGERRRLGEAFSNGMAYPRGPSPDGAAGVANCECSMVIIKEGPDAG